MLVHHEACKCAGGAPNAERRMPNAGIYSDGWLPNAERRTPNAGIFGLVDTVRLSREDVRRIRGPFLDIDEHLPEGIWAAGATEILQNQLLGLYCSADCPVERAPEVYLAVQAIASANTVLVGGF